MTQPARSTPPLESLADLARLATPEERRALIERVALQQRQEGSLQTLSEWQAWQKAHPLPSDAPGEEYNHEKARASLR